MHLEIISPEATLFSYEVDSVVVPGINGEFEMLTNHAPIVSLLQEGIIKIKIHSKNIPLDQLNENINPFTEDDHVLILKIRSGTIEMSNDKMIILAD